MLDPTSFATFGLLQWWCEMPCVRDNYMFSPSPNNYLFPYSNQQSLQISVIDYLGFYHFGPLTSEGCTFMYWNPSLCGLTVDHRTPSCVKETFPTRYALKIETITAAVSGTVNKILCYILNRLICLWVLFNSRHCCSNILATKADQE